MNASWWTIDPSTGDAIRVRPASEVEDARASALDSAIKVDVLRECAARLRPLARRALTEGGASGDQARRDLHEAIDYMARGDLDALREIEEAT